MSIEVSRIELLEGLKKIGQVMNNKASNPIYDNVNMSIDSSSLKLTGGDGDKFLITTVKDENIEIKSNNSLLINFKQLFNFINKSKANMVNIEKLDENKVNVKAGNVNYTLHECHDNYPIMPEIIGTQFKINKDEYTTGIKNTSFAVAKSDSRPILKGVNIEVSKNLVKFVATNSHRLGLYNFNVEVDGDIRKAIDGKSLKKSLKMMDKNTKEINFNIDENYSKLSFDDSELIVKNIEGNYPDTTRLIPEDFNTYIELDSKQTLESLSQLEYISKEDRNSVVRLSGNDKGIKLSASNIELGNMSADLKGEFNGENIEISFNNAYLKEAIKALNSNSIKLSINGAMRPFVITEESNKALQLVLPVRTF
ncbi:MULTISPECIES: DNA polymerase III subunit beta [Lysinibacillus]|uniref:DNA polymerase III subunit beta n=1 Tax=Lysinibacillus TaxID=400634 RepID=UPI00214CB7D0|nr:MULTISPECIES: DNA polymerase III subunit beta [Lysinibacillus]UUV25954.1 DNA polymerase III subunit beta [Lysinibacillus sp. FN11]UYB48827.1 DNA polymerase III subunit beta [Lysinibacillus capsici]